MNVHAPVDTKADESGVERNSAIVERNVLAAAIQHSEWFDLAAFLKVADFHFAEHQALWDTLSSAHRNDYVLDQVSLAAEVSGHPGFESVPDAVGWIRHLLNEHGFLPKRLFANQARIVQRWAQRRRMKEIGLAIDYDADTMPISEPMDIAVGRATAELMRVVADAPRQTRSMEELAQEVCNRAFDPEIAMRNAIRSGYPAIDEKIKAMGPGDMIVLAARTSMGKTAIASGIVKNIMLNNDRVGVLFFQLEMKDGDIASRIICDMARDDGEVIWYTSIRDGSVPHRLKGALGAAAARFAQLDIEINDRSALTVEQMQAAARLCQIQMARRGIRLCAVVVDHLGIITPSGNYRQNRVAEVTEITKGLKHMAKDLDLPVLALCQINRDPEKREDKRPMLADLRESGSIEQDADVILLAYREAYYVKQKQATMDPGTFQATMDRCQYLLEVNAAKVRHGSTGVIKLDFDAMTNSVRDEGIFS